MDYGEIITRAWRITWNNKYLWVLGFLAALGSSGSGGNTGQSFSQSASEVPVEELMRIGAIATMIVCVAFVVGLIIWMVSLAAKGGLINAVSVIDNGETTTLKESLRTGANYIWRMIGAGLLLFLPLIVIMIIAFGVIVGMTGGMVAFTEAASQGSEAMGAGIGLMIACFCGLLCLLIPLFLVAGYMYEFSLRGIVLQKLGVVDSLRHGWGIVRQNVGPVIILAVIFIAVGIGYGILTGIILLPMAFVVMTPLFLMMANGGAPGVLEIMWIVMGGLGLLLIAAALNSILVTWQSATLTLAYQEFIGKGKAA